MWSIDTRRGPGLAAAVLLELAFATGTAASQATYTSDGGEIGDWLTAANWNSDGTPGVAGAAGNTDRALFGAAGASASATNLNSGFSLGAIATTGASGGLLTADFSGNGALRLNGGYSVGPFTNVAAAAQNGRDLLINLTNMQFQFGTVMAATQFYTDADRALAVNAQQINKAGGDLNKEGAGTLIWGGTGTGLQRDLNNAEININGGTFAAHRNLNNVPRIDVASGASLQPGLTTGDTLSTSATVTFANSSSLRILTDGVAVTQLQNASLVKGPNDTFSIVLTGLNPTGAQTFTPNGVVVQASTLTGFDPNGTYTPSTPGDFGVTGDGFTVTDWSLTILNNNQIRLDSVTVTPVPDPAVALSVGALGLTVGGAVRRRG